jgi:glutamine amidotransferase
MITIIDYGLGNLGSVLNMVTKIGAEAQISSDLEIIARADKLILPGVGAFDAAMGKFTDTELRSLLERKVRKEKCPVLGICLGMQLLTRGSEEGRLEGLSWVPAYTYKFPPSQLKVPHIGWNQVKRNTASPLTNRFSDDFRFYFVHSYYVKVDYDTYSILRTQHGISFDSGIQYDNIFGIQFHPEKSHRFGMQLFKNFVVI